MPKPPPRIPRLGQKASDAPEGPVREAAVYPHTQNLEHSLASLPDWDDLRVFLSVVQTGSFTRTASALGLTQPTVSRRVARFEELVGCKLVERGNTGATLTLEGQRVIEELHVAHSAIRRAVDRVASPRPRSEPLTLLTSDGIVTYWLPHFLPELFGRHPDIELRVITASDASILERCNYDFSIHYTLPNDPNQMTIRLGTLHFMPFAAHSYLAKFGRPRSPAELARHRLLDYSLYLIDKGTWLTRLPATIEGAHSQYFTNSSSALAETVRKGAGIGLLPTYGLVFEKGFEALNIGLNFSTPFWLCYQKDALAKPSARIVIQFLKHIFNRKTMPWFADEFIAPEEFADITPEDVMATLSTVEPISAALANR